MKSQGFRISIPEEGNGLSVVDGSGTLLGIKLWPKGRNQWPEGVGICLLRDGIFVTRSREFMLRTVSSTLWIESPSCPSASVSQSYWSPAIRKGMDFTQAGSTG